MNPHPRAPTLWLDAATLARLRQEEPPTAPTDRPEALRERADADPTAQAWLDAFAEDARRADRIARALQFEAVTVQLPDGSALTLDQAEAQLAHKEESRAHASLRGFLDEACGKSLRFDDFRSGNRGPDQAFAREFLDRTIGARDAAREILQTIAKEPIENPKSLARALDLPDPNGAFSAEAALALISSAKKCLKSPTRAIRRIRIPRRLAGLTLEKPDSVLFGTPEPVLRLKRHVRSVFSATLAAQMAMNDAIEEPPRCALALTLGLEASPVRRAVLGTPRAAAEWAERAVLATGLLEARAAAALWANHAAAEVHEDADREALSAALGGDAGRVALLERLDALDATWVEACVGAGAGAWFLREAFDEVFSQQPMAWQLARELKAPSAAEAATAWTALVLERA